MQIPQSIPLIGQGPNKEQVEQLLGEMQKAFPRHPMGIAPGVVWPGESLHDAYVQCALNALLSNKNIHHTNNEEVAFLVQKAFFIASVCMSMRPSYMKEMQKNPPERMNAEAEAQIAAEEKAAEAETIEPPKVTLT